MNLKKLISLMLAFVMMLAVVAPASQVFADQEKHQTTVVIHKMKMSSLEGFPLKQKEGQNFVLGKDGQTQYNGKAISQENISKFFGADTEELEGVTFYVYKVESKDTYEKMVKEPGSYDTKELVEKELSVNQPTQTVVSKKGGVDVENLENGYYWFVEDKASTIKEGAITGAAAVPFGLALPIYKDDGSMFDTQDKLHVYPKNTVNKVQFDKNFAQKNGLEKITDPQSLKDVGAVFNNYEKEKANVKGQIGKEIPYEAKVSLPQGSTFKNLDLVDAMDKGLKYNAKKGVELAVTPVSLRLDLNTHYTITPEANGFKLNFKAEGLKLINDAAKKEEVEITFKYSANVTSDAVVDQPMDNHATIIFNHTPPKFESEEITPKSGEITVTKKWANEGEKTNTVKYVLLDSQGNPVADVTFTAARVVDKTDLGNGITFTVTGDFSGKFSGLSDEVKYKVKEIVNGFEPKFENSEGTVTITNTKTPNSITPTPPQVTVGGKKFVKTNSDGKERLAGAEFVIKNLNSGTDENKFLKVTPADESGYKTAKSAYDEAIKAVNEVLAKGEINAENQVQIDKETFNSKDDALGKVKELYNKMQEEFVKANLNYEWVEQQDQATKFYTDGEGRFEVKGLAYGNYQAVETAAPKGYALPTGGGDFKFEVKDGSYTKDGQINYDKEKEETKDAMQIKNNKVTIPQTGGIGTVIFTVAGLIIMGAAIYALKKNNQEVDA
ncbi:isopeptide-forming domain-containing fimbrial protein [Helcococcus ovis]|uniref:pilin N-terminal domain-containing protein n=1 Tax=Helcococcus ovis TaxID=72026 RepID=UPI00106F0ACA|nr:pilin N-terminal domain-containing protein [Helcococcus ovis]TFF68824.1 isopeptide-forming domain-containing fimbrial protein [Helcococcus ovis]WNZ01154.1 pilin N-terminal domain-containing protein [Helcococcus ovis]